MSNPLLIKENKDIILEQLEMKDNATTTFILNAAWKYIVNYIGYDPMLAPRKEFLKGNGTDRLYLQCRPIVSIEKLVIDTKEVIADFTDRYINIFTNKNYELYELPTMYDHSVTSNISVAYTAGYTELPSLLLMACISLIGSLQDVSSEESKLKAYKINTIAYTFKDFSEKSQEFNDLMKAFL